MSSNRLNSRRQWRPTFVGIGAQKAATSWCWEVLRQHPQVGAAQPKELNFFNDRFDRGLAWYAQHFADPDRPVQGEISPLYMDNPHAAERIASAYPNVTILVVLRDPYERALSNLLHEIRGTDGEVATTGLERARQLAQANDKYVRRSCYAAALAPYFQCFPRSQINVLFYEHLIRNERLFLSTLYRSVGADPAFVPADFQRAVNRTEDYVSPALFKALRSASRLAKTWGLTRSGMEWVYRNTRLREWVMARMTVDRGRPKLAFADVFVPHTAERIAADMNRLVTELGIVVPAEWPQTSAVGSQRSSAA